MQTQSTRRQFIVRSGAAIAGISALRLNPAGVFAADAVPVVGSFSILADWMTNVGGDTVKVGMIVPAGGDAHTFDPKPEVVAQVADAKAILAIGPSFEPWLDDVVKSSGTSGSYVHLSDSIKLVEHHDDDEHEDKHEEASPDADDHDHDHEASTPEADDHDHDDSHHHDGGDPHIWGDVKLAVKSVDIIKDTCSKIDNANVDAYAARADAYTTELNDLDTWIRKEVEKLPKDKRKLITNHDTLGYFAHAYGFEIVGTALGSITTESGDPSAERIAELVDQIKAAKVPAIFAENVDNTDLMQSIAKEAGVTLAPPLYSDALGEAGSDGDTYIKMMKYNVTTIVTALSA